jgi:hypothetical protein
MGIASMVIGIIAAAICWIPFCNYWAFIPAVVGLVLGVVEMNKKKKAGEPRGMAISGVVLNIVAMVLIFVWTIALADSVGKVGKAAKEYEKNVEKFQKDLDKYK